MRKVGSVMLLAGLLLMGLPVGVQGQSVVDEVEIITESETDLAVNAFVADAPDGDRFAQSDLAGLYVSEGPDTITFRVQVRDVAPDDEVLLAEQGEVTIHFLLGDPQQVSTSEESETNEDEGEGEVSEGVVTTTPQYALEIHHSEGQLWGSLYLYDPASDRYVYAGDLDDDQMQVDVGTSSYLVTVPRDYLLDFNGAPVSPGLPMHDFVVESSAGLPGYQAYDVMPDDGEGVGEYVPVLGVKQTGHLHLSSPAPVRASNGEATTYVYDITLASVGDFVDDVDLEVVGAPSNWQVKLPADSVRIDNETLIHLPVLVTTPFGHEHGSFVSFTIEAKSTRDPSSVGRVELGVRYTAIPQPAGHHAQLWLHSSDRAVNQIQDGINTVVGSSGAGGSYAYFNAAQGDDDERDQAIDVHPNGGKSPCITQERPACMQYTWDIYLEPTLQMGLDFDVNGTGELSVPFSGNVPIQDAYIEGELYYQRASGAVRNDFEDEVAVDDGGVVLLGTFTASESKSGSVGTTVTFDTEFTPTPESNFILYEPAGASVWMELRLITMSTTTFFGDGQLEPVLVPGGELLLPLNEYHDPVDDLYNQLTDVEVLMEGEQEQYVNSGETVLFEVRIENTGVVNDDFEIILGGHNQEWATILGDTSFSVRSQESRRVVIAVAAPLDTDNGDTADLVLEAISKSDDNARALVRLYAEVDNLIDHEDKSHLVPITHEELTYTPVGSWLAPLSLLGALLVLRRTRLQ